MPTLVFIHGAPASGKLTVARALLRLTSGRLFDNHAAIDFARTLFDFGAPGFWELVQAARLAALREAVEQGLPLVAMTFCYAEPEDRTLFAQFEDVFAQRGGRVLPVFLYCSQEEAQRRVGNADRVDRRKIASITGLADFSARWNMAPVPRANCLVLSTETDTANATASKITQHFGLAETAPT
jgi:hypothetical protein